MKKIIILLLVALLLTACTSAHQGNPDLQITRATEPNATEEVPETTEAVVEENEDVFYFMVGDVKVIPGTAFDATKIPYEDIYEIPSCAGEGTDKVYMGSSYDITAFNDGKSEIVYCIAFVTPEAQTPEGLCLGDEMEKAATLYGSYEQDGNFWVFTRGNTQLHIVGENGVITNIELRTAN